MLQHDLEGIVGSPLTAEREFIFAGVASEVRQLVARGGEELLIDYVQGMVARNMSMHDALKQSENAVASYRTCINDLAARVQRHDINGCIPLRQVIHDWWSQWVSKVSS